MTLKDMKDQLAVVTGAASGIGRATAAALAAQGARIIVADINAEAGEQAAAELRAAGHQAEYLAVDLTDPASIPYSLSAIAFAVDLIQAS